MTSRINFAAMNFSWVSGESLAGCRAPQTTKHLKFLAAQGIRVLVRLVAERESPITAAQVKRAGMQDLHEPVDDFSPPPQDQIDRVVSATREARSRAKPVAISCLAGYGRSGTMLACYFVAEGRSASDAIRHVIFKRPCSAELLRVPGQEDAVHEFERRFRSGEATL